MSGYLEKASKLIFSSYVREGLGENAFLRNMQINLIVMSRHTERELMREDVHQTLVSWRGDATQPNRMGPARVAYDDTMGLGEMIVAEAKGDIRE